MDEIKRNDLHLISKHSNIEERVLQKALADQIYTQKNDWKKFLKLLFLSFAIGFTVTGIIFFFAFNWDNLHKFVKLGIIQSLILAGITFVLVSKSSVLIKNIILTGTSVLVGALFAVFGQIYQTGANAYDFFLGWTVFITIWVMVSNFAPLWLLLMILINTTFYFYTEQVANHWDSSLVYLLFLLFNASGLIFFLTQTKKQVKASIPYWFTTILACAVTVLTIISLIYLDRNEITSLVIITLLVVFIIYALAVYEARVTKNIIYLALLAVSIIITVIYYLLRNINDTGTLLLIAMFCLAAFSVTIILLLNLQKKWNNEK